MERDVVLTASRPWQQVLLQHLSRSLAVVGMCLGAPVDPRAVAVRSDGSPVLTASATRPAGG